MIKEKEDGRKKKILSEYIKKENDSWEDVKIVLIESTNKFRYQTTKGLRPLSLMPKQAELLRLVLISKQSPLAYDFKHDKTTFARLNKCLKDSFNKSINPLEWNGNQKVYKYKCQFKKYTGSIDYKKIGLTKKMTSRLQCNLEEIE